MTALRRPVLRFVEPTARRGSAEWSVKSRDAFIGLRLVEAKGTSLRLGEKPLLIKTASKFTPLNFPKGIVEKVPQ